MHVYRIRFHKGTPAKSEVVAEFHCEAESDIPACAERVRLEEIYKDDYDFDFSICGRAGYFPDDFR